MSFFLGKEIKEKNSLRSVLTSIFGLGSFLAKSYCKELGLKPNSKYINLTNKQKTFLINFIVDNKKTITQEVLFRKINERLATLIKIRCYRGLRHKLSLPLRGQRTHTNGKTAKKLNKTRIRIK